jgi:hypothetical protein
MKSIYLTIIALIISASAFSQLAISDLMVEGTDNALRMDVSFSTNDNARSFIEYSRVVMDDEGNVIDTTTQYTPLSEETSDHYFNVWELVAETEYTCTLWAHNANGCASEEFTFTTDPLPLDVPVKDSLYVHPDADLHGYFLTNTVQTADKTLQIFNRRGEVVWYTYHAGAPELGNTQNCQMFNIHGDNEILTLECHEINRWDLEGNLINNVDLNGTPYDTLFFHHDVIINDIGNYVVVAANAKVVDFGDSTDVVIGENLLEITPDGDVVWSWSAFDHFDPTLDPLQGSGFFTPLFGPESHNWLHCNAVYQDEDGKYIMSHKIQHQLVKVDEVTGDVEWVIGGNNATLPVQPFDEFGDQHAIVRTFVGTYMIFDNTALDSLSRFFEFSLEVYDELTVVPQWDYVLPQDNFSHILGNANRRPGGFRYGCSGISGATIEVDQFGEVLWHFEQSSWLYRTFYIENLIDASIDDITMGNNPDLLCIDEGAVDLAAEPVGGCWSGPGVEDGAFDPNVAGLGTHTLTFRWGWNEMTIDIEVSDAIPPCAVGLDDPFPETFAIFPNPNNGSFGMTIPSESEELIQIKLVDMLGKTVWTTQRNIVVGVNMLELNTELAAGNYTLVLNGKQGAQNQLIVIR